MAKRKWQMADGRWQMADGRWQMAEDLISSARLSAIWHLPFAILVLVNSLNLDGRRPYRDHFFACPSANAWSKSRPGDLKPIFSVTKRAASAAPYSRSMPGSSHSTESGPA